MNLIHESMDFGRLCPQKFDFFQKQIKGAHKCSICTCQNSLGTKRIKASDNGLGFSNKN